MEAPDLPCELAVANNVIVELVPTKYQLQSKQSNRKEAYHSVKAASLGPGNFAIGLKYNRYIAPVIKVQDKMTTDNSITEEYDGTSNKIDGAITEKAITEVDASEILS